jgi:acetyl esterase/lipase
MMSFHVWISKINTTVMRTLTNMNRSEMALCVLAAIVLKAVHVPRASIMSNIVHLLYKLVCTVVRPMHLIPETDLRGIRQQRSIYSLLTVTEPKYEAIREQLSFQSKSGHVIHIEMHKSVTCASNKKLPLVIFFHGGGFVIGNVSIFKHVNCLYNTVLGYR